MPSLTKEKALAKLQRRLDRIEQLTNSSYDAEDVVVWKKDTQAALGQVFGTESSFAKRFGEIKYIRSDRRSSPLKQDFEEGLRAAAALLRSAIDEVEDDWEDEQPTSPASQQNTSRTDTGQATDSEQPVENACIFIGHGRSPLWARLQVFIQNDLNLQTVSYESESRVGQSIVPVLERMLDQANFAVLILTAEDESASGSKRARQNVIHEVGLFQGRLGFKKTILMIEEGLEEFSNIAGLQYIPFRADRIEDKFYELQRVLKREGLLQ
jgi:predicted nucleotide-binding protein